MTGLYVGSAAIQNAYAGSTAINSAYVGSTLIWPAGTTYYKWVNEYMWDAYTTSATPSVGDRIAQKVGTTLCYTAKILSVSSGSLIACSSRIDDSGASNVQWTAAGTVHFLQAQPVNAYKWQHSTVASHFITPNRNPAVNDPIYTVDYNERIYESSIGPVYSVTTDGSGDVVSFVPSRVISGIYCTYDGVFAPTGSL